MGLWQGWLIPWGIYPNGVWAGVVVPYWWIDRDW